MIVSWRQRPSRTAVPITPNSRGEVWGYNILKGDGVSEFWDTRKGANITTMMHVLKNVNSTANSLSYNAYLVAGRI